MKNHAPFAYMPPPNADQHPGLSYNCIVMKLTDSDIRYYFGDAALRRMRHTPGLVAVTGWASQPRIASREAEHAEAFYVPESHLTPVAK